MKRTYGTTLILVLLMTGFLTAQSSPDEEYLKAMQISDPCQKVQALKAYVSKYGGQGTQYEKYAQAYICLTPCKTTPPQDAIRAGEKALTMSGLDADTRLALIASLPTIYLRTNQTDKARESAQRLIDYGTTTKTDKLIGAGHYLIGQAAEKAKDYGAAAEAYITSYGILKNPQIAADLKKLGKSLYDAKKFADAEKIYRQFYASAKDAESAIILGQTLNKMGKTDEALDLFKEAYSKKKTGELAYNIAIILNGQAKSNPSLVPDVINYFLEASLLYPAKSKDCMQYAQSLYFTNGNNAKYNEIINKIQEHNKVIEEYTKTFNERYEGKNESDLTGREKSALSKLQEAMDRERAAIAKLQAEQKTIVDGFNRLVNRVRSRLGK